MRTDTRGAWLLLVGGAAVIIATLGILLSARDTAMAPALNPTAQHAAVARR